MPDAPESSQSPPAAVVGAGAVGTTLARRLVACGYPVRALFSRSAVDARRVADRVGADVASETVSTLPGDVRLVMLCVPDDALSSVAEQLAAVEHPWKQTMVAHTSGRQPAAVLSPVARAGASVLSFHPLQTFVLDTPPEAFEGIIVGIEGEEEAVHGGRSLARALGARPITLSAEDKARYHAAAALASNGLVALMGAVQELMSATEIAQPSPLRVVAPLVESTWANVKEQGAAGALTGPVARGDQNTVEAHLNALSEGMGRMVPLYAALATEQARLAVRRGDLNTETAESLLRVLHDALRASTEEAS